MNSRVIFYLVLAFCNLLSVNNIYCKDIIEENLKRFDMVTYQEEGTPLYKQAQLIYGELFKRGGFEFTLEYQPIKRANYNLNKGVKDGEPGRAFDYSKHSPNLIRVEESVLSMYIVAYSRYRLDERLDGWGSLKGRNFRVEYPLGFKHCSKNLSSIIPEERLSEIDDTYQGLLKLLMGRTDIYIGTKSVILPQLKKFKAELYQVGTMEEIPLFLFVHKKYRKYQSLFSKIMRDMKREGLIDRYHKEAFNIR